TPPICPRTSHPLVWLPASSRFLMEFATAPTPTTNGSPADSWYAMPCISTASSTSTPTATKDESVCVTSLSLEHVDEPLTRVRILGAGSIVLAQREGQLAARERRDRAPASSVGIDERLVL